MSNEAPTGLATIGPAATPPAPSPAGTPSLSPTRIASMRERWISLGLDVERFDRAAIADAVPTPPPQPSGNEGEPVEYVETGGMPRFSDEQAANMADALSRAGVPADKIEAALKADGYDVGISDASDEQTAHDAEWGFDRNYQPSDYKISYGDALRRAGSEVDPASLSALNTSLTTGLANMQIRPELGAAIVERAMDIGQAKMDAAARQLFKVEQRQLVERRAGGSEQLAERLRLAGVMLKMAGPEFAEHLFRSGAADDAWIVETLANEGRRLQGWIGKRP